MNNIFRYFHKILKVRKYFSHTTTDNKYIYLPCIEPILFYFIKNIRFRPFLIFWYAYRKIIYIFFPKSAKSVGAKNVTDWSVFFTPSLKHFYMIGCFSQSDLYVMILSGVGKWMHGVRSNKPMRHQGYQSLNTRPLNSMAFPTEEDFKSKKCLGEKCIF